MKINYAFSKGFWIVSFTYLIVVLLMLPFREVGFSDDFAYHHSVGYLVNEGVLKINNWSATSLIFQVIWGAIFSFISPWQLLEFSQREN